MSTARSNALSHTFWTERRSRYCTRLHHAGWRAVRYGIAAVFAAIPAFAQEQVWVKQLGTSGSESGAVLAADGFGGFYAAGTTAGSLWAPNMGSDDAWVARFDSDGNPIWGKQFGTPLLQPDVATAIAAHPGSAVFVGGYTWSTLGASKIGSVDAWVGLYDSNGNAQWLRQFGSLDEDLLYTIIPRTDGGLYIGGKSNGLMTGPQYGKYDIWVARLSPAGYVLWSVKLGTSEDETVTGGALDASGGVIVCGSTSGSLAAPNAGASDAWVARLDESGTLLWQRQIGTWTSDSWNKAQPDGLGGAFLIGSVGSSPSVQDFARINVSGDFLWIKPFSQYGTASLRSITPDGSGGLYACATVNSEYGGPTIGYSDVAVVRFDGDGNELWFKKFGSTSFDYGSGVAVDGAGGAFVAGSTLGDVGGPNAGSQDIWMARVDGSCGVGPEYCSPSATSIAGCSAELASLGSPRAAFPEDFDLFTGPVPGGNVGLCLFGADGPASTPFGTLGGKLCVAAPFFRTAPKASGGAPGECNGSYAFTLADLADASPIVAPGAVLHAQVWARDPANPDGFLLSDGMEISVCP